MHTVHTDIMEHDGCFSATIFVKNELGLHARPAARIAQEAQKFKCELRMQVSEQEVDAKSILDILSLAAGHGSEIVLTAKGDDARQAMEHMAQLFHSIVGEEA